ncbi:hypothetical protein N9Z27_02825, partial [Alphaproteobacteria bacterium]|nr:hypothetical protein [Alphaproteobacteria bacterium]
MIALSQQISFPIAVLNLPLYFPGKAIDDDMTFSKALFMTKQNVGRILWPLFLASWPTILFFAAIFGYAIREMKYDLTLLSKIQD